MSTIALEAQSIVRSAAEPVKPGETIKGQINRAASSLKFPHWRVREAWYSGAGSWSARALEELRARHVARLEKARTKQATDAANHAARLEALASRLTANDPEFHASDIAAAIEQARRLRNLIAGGI